jgi:CRISPR/Cas system-associated exonuclease Cas4 (RecB family)
LEKNHAPGVNLVNTTVAQPNLTNLTANMASMKRIARDIASDQQGWSWDNCKVKPADISAASLKTVLESYPDRLTEKAIHDAWREAVTRTHKAIVDGLPEKSPAGYAVACFKEQLESARERASENSGTATPS